MATDGVSDLNSGAYVQWKGWLREGKFAECSTQSAAYFDAELRKSGAYDRTARPRVLEIGFGNGEFAGFCRSRHFGFVGTEASAELVAAARSAGYEAYGLDQSLRDIASQFDAVVAFDVFEHLELPALRKLLLDIRHVLSSHGVIIARFPSGDSPFARSIQHGDLTHRLSLGSSAVTQLAQECGLRVRRIREPEFLYRGLTVQQYAKRLGVQSIRRILFPFIRTVFLSGSQVVLTQSMVAVLELPTAPLKVDLSDQQ